VATLNAQITVDSHANAVIVVARGCGEQGMHTIASGIDVSYPTDTATGTYQLKVISGDTVAARLSGVFPGAWVLVAPNRNVIITGSPSDMGQIKAIIAAIDTAPPTPRHPAEACASRGRRFASQFGERYPPRWPLGREQSHVRLPLVAGASWAAGMDSAPVQGSPADSHWATVRSRTNWEWVALYCDGMQASHTDWPLGSVTAPQGVKL
jgi:hypothetical protein